MQGAIAILVLLTLADVHAAVPPVEQVSARMAETRARNRALIRGYTVLRRYTLTTGHSGHHAEMLVRVTYAWPNHKKFEVVSERGSNAIQKRVFHRLLKAEEDASHHDAHLTPDNYTFQPEGMATLDGRRCYVMRLTPKSSGKYLIRGRVWIDATDFAVVRVEGEPVDSGSFWITGTHVVQTYKKVGGFWLQSVNESDSDVRIFGRAHLKIENLDYKIDQADTEDRASLAPRAEVE